MTRQERLFTMRRYTQTHFTWHTRSLQPVLSPAADAPSERGAAPAAQGGRQRGRRRLPAEQPAAAAAQAQEPHQTAHAA